MMKPTRLIVKITIAIIVAIILMFSFNMKVKASNNALESVHSEAVINNDGTVDIEQTWVYDDTNLTEGTEHYINLNASYGEEGIDHGVETITDYEVYRNGELMTFDSNWNIDNSFEHKAGKYGLVNTGLNSVELTFGITERTLNEYVVKYKVHNIIKETSDGFKYLHWTFLPTELDPNPSTVTAEITVQDGVEIDKIYGFEYEGLVGYLEDDKAHVFAEMTGDYTDDTTLNIFTLFEDESNLISNTERVELTLDEKADEILEDSDYDKIHFYQDTFETMSSDEAPKDPLPVRIIQFILNGITFIFGTVFFVIPVLVVIVFVVVLIKMNPMVGLTGELDKEDATKLRTGKDFYYRNEPDEFTYSSVLIKKLIATKNGDNDLLSYYISKWTSDGVFEHYENKERGILIFKTKSIVFKLNEDKLSPNSELESSLFKEFYKLADEYDLVDTRKLRKLDIKAISKLIKAHDEIAYKELQEMGYIVQRGKKESRVKKGPFKGLKFISADDPVLTQTGGDLMFQHAGLRNFLNEFTLINEREASEIKLWDYYFHMAALYGVTEKFKAQLKDIPNLTEGDKIRYNKYYGNTSTAALSRTVSSSVKSAYNSSSSGGSSRGGGGGSSGGGSGGGTR